jgi:hypothetical protein
LNALTPIDIATYFGSQLAITDSLIELDEFTKAPHSEIWEIIDSGIDSSKKFSLK